MYLEGETREKRNGRQALKTGEKSGRRDKIWRGRKGMKKKNCVAHSSTDHE
jgi:hypothetical protein